MVVLKKLKASTLMETMVATTLIVVIFMMASMLLNTLFSSTLKGDNQRILERLNELDYAQKQQLITLPHMEEWEQWNIEINPETIGTMSYVVFEATNKNTGKQLKTYTSFD